MLTMITWLTVDDDVYVAASPRSSNDIPVDRKPFPEAKYDREAGEWYVPDDALAAAARAKRNELLSETDRYMIVDFPIDDNVRKDVVAYRMKLRDITKQEGFPKDIEWPELPKGI